ncbi:LOW QUALITY PROTEIN: hypothetical protein M8C21_014454 [Ambrosia artemisiifolia]|uniref:Uncharacterized protein n=1 Tax=Ambrosia artemisiifolia TaxID=4212 RepID=A0AAD5DA44_AMBAR|nr:LOW QUALITY PROTEIN: hypothetical protein M8C21_014454 [Ambrosia artemisiifolia]
MGSVRVIGGDDDCYGGLEWMIEMVFGYGGRLGWFRWRQTRVMVVAVVRYSSVKVPIDEEWLWLMTNEDDVTEI